MCADGFGFFCILIVKKNTFKFLLVVKHLLILEILQEAASEISTPAALKDN
jgi:hypothetical protein